MVCFVKFVYLHSLQVQYRLYCTYIFHQHRNCLLQNFDFVCSILDLAYRIGPWPQVFLQETILISIK